ncbi:MAG: crosslink repair DNA glycosylase YcaQ family protein [Acidimicrobiales bacterium]
MKVRRLTRDEARRIAIRAQLLDAKRPKDLLAVVDRLAFLQLDPTAAVAPSADLVAWSRIGNRYNPAHLQQAVERDRTLFEHRGQEVVTEPVVAMVRPMANLGLYLADMAAWPSGSMRRTEWLRANDAFRRRVLKQLRASGPLPSRAIPDTAAMPWESSGWTHDRNVTQMLEFLGARGEIAVAGRRGKQRLWDLAERVYPAGMKVLPADEARKTRDANRLQSLGVARPQMVGEAGVPAEIEDTSGMWRLDPKATAKDFEGRTALLSPFDRLIHDRVRALELFDFEYLLEMYKPKDKRRWGFFALPVLHHDRLVGKVDATADRKSSKLLVDAVHQDVKFTRAMTAAVNAELHALAEWLGLDEVRPAKSRENSSNR